MTLANSLKSIYDYPDVSFIGGYTLEKLTEDMMSWYKEKYREVTGEQITMADGDERRIKLMACAYYIFQGYQMTDEAGKMGLLKYSHDGFLENLGAMNSVSRLPATGATTTIRFSLQEKGSSATGIPQGTRVTAGNSIYFATDEYTEIPAGDLYVDVGATCTTTGAEGNNFDIGEINTMVDPVPFVATVTNTTAPENGADVESDESLKERIFMAPSGYSDAGTADAYEYFIRSYNPGITDIKISSPEPRVAKIQYLLENGKLPEEESISGLKEYLEQTDIKAMTDVIQVSAPDQSEYSIQMTYYINRSDSANAGSIQEKINEAVEEYKRWQSEKIGRDINPDKLRQLVLAAGAKRTEITAPTYQKVTDTAVAVLKGEASCTYGGLEDD